MKHTVLTRVSCRIGKCRDFIHQASTFESFSRFRGEGSMRGRKGLAGYRCLASSRLEGLACEHNVGACFPVHLAGCLPGSVTGTSTFAQ